MLMMCLVLCTSCSTPSNKKSPKINITPEEHVWLEKFFRYFMFHDTAIYTLLGSKPLTEMTLCYEELPKEILREKERESYVYFQLNKKNKKDMEFYKKLTKEEKEEKAYLIRDKDFIYDINELWEKWEKIQHRFPIKKKYLLIKKLRPSYHISQRSSENSETIYDIYLVNVHNTALVIQENYDLFKKMVGFDFDPLEIVFELENEKSDFWDVHNGKDPWRYCIQWGLLYGFDKNNSYSYMWKGRHFKLDCSEKELNWSNSVETWSSCPDRPCVSDRKAFSISNFPLPAFKTFFETDPVIEKYKNERKKIKQLYKRKDFVTFTLEQLTDPLDNP